MPTGSLTVSLLMEMAFSFVGGLAIFLLGMKYMSDGVQAVAGERLRRMISMVTNNRLAACGTGLFVTALIQSSSVTTVMMIGLVNAGVMTLTQSIGVILGADIGTTITAWIVAVKVTKYGLLVLGIAGFFYLFTQNERRRFVAMLVMGLGMVFFGLTLMEQGVYPLRSNPDFVSLFSRFAPHTYFGVIKCVLIGSIVTAVIQSSSATIAITITLARSGVIDFDTSVALVLGQNIGTTITAFLGSLGMNINARRVAYAHIFIKIMAVVIMIPFFFTYLSFVNHIIHADADIATRIALSHTIFNVLLVLAFLPFTGLLAALLLFLFRDRSSTPQKPGALTILDVRLLDTPMISVEQSRHEILRMGAMVGEMMASLRTVLNGGDGRKEKVRELFNQEEILDRMQHEIVAYLAKLLTQEIPSSIAKEAQEQLRRADEYESASDYIVAILKLHLRLENAGLALDKEETDDLQELHNAVSDYFRLIFDAHRQRTTDILTIANPQGEGVTHLFREMRARHLAKMSQKQLDPLICTIYPDMLSAYRRIKEHLLNVAEAVAGAK